MRNLQRPLVRGGRLISDLVRTVELRPFLQVSATGHLVYGDGVPRGQQPLGDQAERRAPSMAMLYPSWLRIQQLGEPAAAAGLRLMVLRITFSPVCSSAPILLIAVSKSYPFG
jgi:hypothetical protein